jgi:hypothetical protein
MLQLKMDDAKAEALTWIIPEMHCQNCAAAGVLQKPKKGMMLLSCQLLVATHLQLK